MEYLIVDKEDNMEDDDTTYRVPSTYLHGNIEKDAGFDIFKIHGKELYDKICGIESEVTYETFIKLFDKMIPVMMFCWRTPENALFGGLVYGLVCYPDDSEAINDAMMKQKEKTSRI